MSPELEEFKVKASEKLIQLYNLECTTVFSSDDSKYFEIKNNVRTILNNLLLELEKHKNCFENTYYLRIWGFLRAKLAVNYIETEEKHEARRIFNELIEKLTSILDLKKLIQIIHNNAGIEENQDSELILPCALDQSVLKSFTGVLQICYNSLAIICQDCQSPDYDTHKWLLLAQALYELYHSVFPNLELTSPDCWESLDLFDNLHKYFKRSKTDIIKLKWIMFETGYTSSIFMLAQVYANLKEPSKAAEYCRRTLTRQLSLANDVNVMLDSFAVETAKPEPGVGDVFVAPLDWLSTSLSRFDITEWASNASALSQFYANSEEHQSALECLFAALTVLSRTWTTTIDSRKVTVTIEMKTVDPEKFIKARSDIAFYIIEYAINLLEMGRKLSEKAISEGHQKGMSSSDATHFGALFSLDTEAELTKVYAALSESLQVNGDATVIMKLLTSPPTDWTAAFCLFRWIIQNIHMAQAFYTLEDYCSQHVDLIRAHARAYNGLCFFESEPHRQSVMQKRRADLLSTLLDRLNPQFYLVTSREIMLELTDAYTSRLNIAQHKITSSGTTEEKRRANKKTNELALQAINLYKRFLNSFRKPTEKSLPEFYEDSDIRSVILAHLHSARLHSRIYSTIPKERLHHLQSALMSYETLIQIAERHYKVKPHLADVLGAEVELAREISKLLPVEIATVLSALG